VRQASAGLSIAALIAFAIYSVIIVIIAISGEGGGLVFWASIALILLLAAAALWGAKVLFGRRFAGQKARPTQ
jgi:hypothetical protein